MKNHVINCLLAALLLAVAGCATAPELSLWRDGAPAKTALLEYVAAVTDESSPDFIPPARRIAVFDLDGTLFCETDPTYFDWLFFEHRVMDDPSYAATEEQRSAVRKARAKGEYPPLGKERERMIAEAYRGLGLDALCPSPSRAIRERRAARCSTSRWCSSWTTLSERASPFTW